ncbi:hypothetical protein [Rhodophyticola sp.]|jgi:hypothetical protein|uniref:hypothetical protein n=1 Tax=Rhodophyticola sp. TaxID=2680032 RepID=UPI001B1EE392|nr:hypothetical protein [Roseicyclus sp.]MBO6626702.1 hypothetical protein [Roseicyclus sp.]MBO6922366.1 hypothetical protein [Roseicyclus sp.]
MAEIKPRETVIKRCGCAGCGKQVQVKLNKNGCAYYYCPWADETGDPCNHQQRWGKAASAKMIAAYEAGGDDPAPRPAPEPEPAEESTNALFG